MSREVRVGSSRYELLPCPFCGGRARVRKKWGNWTAYCLECHASSDRYVPGGTYYESCETKDEAVERWNRRTHD